MLPLVAFAYLYSSQKFLHVFFPYSYVTRTHTIWAHFYILNIYIYRLFQIASLRLW